MILVCIAAFFALNAKGVCYCCCCVFALGEAVRAPLPPPSLPGRQRCCCVNSPSRQEGWGFSCDKIKSDTPENRSRRVEPRPRFISHLLHAWLAQKNTHSMSRLPAARTTPRRVKPHSPCSYESAGGPVTKTAWNEPALGSEKQSFNISIIPANTTHFDINTLSFSETPNIMQICVIHSVK